MTSRATPILRSNSRGFSLVELLIVMTLMAIISAIALPRLLNSSRFIGSAGIPRELATYLRFARQEAVSQKVVVTCRYNNQDKTISIINHRERGITYDPNTDSMVTLPGNPAPSADQVTDMTIERVPLARPGVPSGDITLGRVDGNPATAALDDGTQMVTLSASNQINITFQPDGSIVNAQNVPINRTLFLYNQQIQKESAFAVSVLGTTGRVKLWRFDSNANKYYE